MDLLSRVNARKREREKARLKILQEEAVFKKPEKAYTFSTKKLTIILFILVILAVVGIMLSSELVIKNQCGLMPGIECSVATLTGDRINLQVSNYLKEDLNITLSIEGCNETIANYIRPNTMAEYSFRCSSATERVEKKIEMTYVGYSGLSHTKQGWMEGKRA